MKEEYDIFYNGSVVGKVHIKTEGMFCCLHCVCRLTNRNTVNLWYEDERMKLNLGICACDGSSFIKRMKRGDLMNGSFFIKAKQAVCSQMIYYIDDNIDPMMIMDNLTNLRLCKENGRPGLVIISSIQD